MECAIITTYRCNAKCIMCNAWKNPTRPQDEFEPQILQKIPSGMKRLNITGGEPLLRKDLNEIIGILDKKTSRLEISTNGYFTEKIAKIAENWPRITFRISIEGLAERNDRLRGIKMGFEHAVQSLTAVKNAGLKDIGFAMVISQYNVRDLLSVYDLTSMLDVEFSQSTMHNSFYFHKHDNVIEPTVELHEIMHNFIRRLLMSKRKNLQLRVKDWFRAYINMGLLRYIDKRTRTIVCGAGTDSFFVDPWGRILACNGSDEPWIMGDLKTQSFDDIWRSDQAAVIRKLVSKCDKNCWMTGSSVPAMRRKLLIPVVWVMKNKMRLMFGYNLDPGTLK